MKHTLIVISVIALLCIGPATAGAQIRPGVGSVTLFLGSHTFNELQGDTDLLIGIRAGSNLTRYFGLEASLDVIPTGEDITVVGYQGNVVLNLLPGYTVVPYITAGIGGVTFTGGGFSESWFAANIGVGVKISTTERVGIRIEARNRTYRLSDDPDSDLQVTVGLELFLGRS